MASLSLFKIPAAIWAHAKSLIVGDDDEGVAPAQAGAASDASRPGASGEWDPATQDSTFWATMAGADRRLAELRRAIEEAAAEAMSREGGDCSASDQNAVVGESRFETANRMINDALKTTKS